MKYAIVYSWATLTFLLLSGISAIHAQSVNSSTIKWHKFQWETDHNAHLENTSSRISVAKFNISGIPDAQMFELSLSSPFSYIYEDAYQKLLYINPSLANQTETVQRVSNFHERVLRNMEFSIDRQILGEENLRLKTHPNGEKNQRINGILGFGIFHRNQKILLVDNVDGTFAAIDELPAEFESMIHFVPMKVEAGYIVIPVNIGSRIVEMFFDGTSRPAMVMFHNRTFRQIASGRTVGEKLLHYNGKEEILISEGFEPTEQILFGAAPLSALNVYYSNQKAPSNVRGTLSRASFDNYILVFDYKNERFGIMNHELMSK